MSEFMVRDAAGVRWVPIERQMMIGRSLASDLVLQSALASRRHAWVWRVGDQVVIEDLGSTHGTYVNGQPLLLPRVLSHRDVVTVGDAQLTFVTFRNEAAAGGRLAQDEAITPPGGVPRYMASQIFCAHCGAPNPLQSTYCTNCGQPISLPPAPVEARVGEWGAGSGQRITPTEPVLPRPFPRASAPPARSRGGSGVLILLLAILAVVLLTSVAVLLVLLLG